MKYIEKKPFWNLCDLLAGAVNNVIDIYCTFVIIFFLLDHYQIQSISYINKSAMTKPFCFHENANIDILYKNSS